MRIPSKSAMTGAGRSEANAANAVFLACRAYKPRRQLCREQPRLKTHPVAVAVGIRDQDLDLSLVR